MVKKSFKEIQVFTHVAQLRLNRELSPVKKYIPQDQQTKFNLCLIDLIGDAEIHQVGTLAPALAEYDKRVRRLRRNHASTDERGNLITVPGPTEKAPREFVYSSDSLNLLEDALLQLEGEQVEIEPSYCRPADLPKDLNHVETRVFQGFVIQSL